MLRPSILVLVLTLCAGIYADEHTHTYEDGSEVVLWYGTVGPYANHQETYDFLQLPYCTGSKTIEHHHETLGEALIGVSLVNSGIEIHYKVPVTVGEICSVKLSTAQVNLFRYAVVNNYYYQIYIDDLPMWDFVGKTSETSPANQYIYTHRDIEIQYNDDRIIQVDLKSGNPKPLQYDIGKLDLAFTYSVTWTPTTKLFHTRFNRYLDSSFFEHKIHWYSIINSFIMVIFLTAMVAVILLRALRKDYARYDKEEAGFDLDRDIGDDYGWKQVHGDVFRPPAYLTAFSAFVGTGVQLLTMTTTVILWTIVGDLYIERATMLTASIFIYALTSMISGYFAGSIYAQYGGKNWIGTMLFTSMLWPGCVCGTALAVNAVAWPYGSSKAIPFLTMLAIIAIWLFLVFPLTLLGSIIGRNWAGEPHFPTRVNPIPRPIPDKVWWSEPSSLIALSGLLPFGSIFIEIYYIFSSFFAYKIYYVYGFMLLVLLVLLTVVACVAVVSTYFLLNSEDHRWHWITFFASGSAAFYIFGYSMYYFHVNTKMYGLFQSVFYFGYTALACFTLFIVLGSVGYFATDIFIRKIYRNVKTD